MTEDILAEIHRTPEKQDADDIQELDAIINNKYTRQPEKLRAWQTASRVERTPQREKKKDLSTTGSTSPTP